MEIQDLKVGDVFEYTYTLQSNTKNKEKFVGRVVNINEHLVSIKDLIGPKGIVSNSGIFNYRISNNSISNIKFLFNFKTEFDILKEKHPEHFL